MTQKTLKLKNKDTQIDYNLGDKYFHLRKKDVMVFDIEDIPYLIESLNEIRWRHNNPSKNQDLTENLTEKVWNQEDYDNKH